MWGMMENTTMLSSPKTSVRVAIFGSRLYAVFLCDGVLVHKICVPYKDVALSLRDFWCTCKQCGGYADCSDNALFKALDEMIVCRGPGSFTSYRALCSFVMGIKAVHTGLSVSYVTLFDLLKMHYLAIGNVLHDDMIFAVGSEASGLTNGACYVCYHINAHVDHAVSDVSCGRVKIGDDVYQTASLQDALFDDRVVIATNDMCIEHAAEVDVVADFLDVIDQTMLIGDSCGIPLYLPLRPNAKF